MLLVGYWHGLRASEIISLTPAHFNDGYLTVQRLKGSKKTTQPLMAHSDPLLDERTAVPRFLASFPSNSTGRLFPISRARLDDIIKHDGKLANIPAHKRHAHVLKHSVALHMIREAGIENVKQYLGHKSGASTMEYLKASDEEAAAAIARAERSQLDMSDLLMAPEERLTASEQLRRVARLLEHGEAKGKRRKSR